MSRSGRESCKSACMFSDLYSAQGNIFHLLLPWLRTSYISLSSAFVMQRTCATALSRGGAASCAGGSGLKERVIRLCMIVMEKHRCGELFLQGNKHDLERAIRTGGPPQMPHMIQRVFV